MTLVAPFAVIARELTSLRELYEADLAARDKPVYRVTQDPSSSDTEVTYSGEEKPRTPLQRLLQGDIEDDPEDQSS